MPKGWCLLLICLSYGLCISSSTAKADARLAIIIDDIGYNQSQSARAARLHGAFTISVLPFTPHGLASAQLAHDLGKELMLHLPMSTINNLPLGKGALISGMEKTAFLTTIRQNLNNIPHIQGVNNHMGSRLTQEIQPMQWLMEELRPRGLYFVDSRTTAQTKAFDTANNHQVPSLKRDVFLDDIEEQGAIEFQLNRAFQLARQQGTAIAIGHPYPVTLAILERIQPLLEKQQVKLVYASQLLKVAALSPIQRINIPIVEPSELTYCPIPQHSLLIEVYTNVDYYDKAGIISPAMFGY